MAEKGKPLRSDIAWSNAERMDALVFGAGDFSVSQGVGIATLDAPSSDYQDGDGYQRDARRAALMGFTGKCRLVAGQREPTIPS